MDESFLVLFFKKEQKEALLFEKRRIASGDRESKNFWGCPRSGTIVTVE
jgi:hypothetical protein